MTLPDEQADTIQPALETELAQMLVTELGLEVSAQDIDPTQPLYGDGLGLDSIDILEVALLIGKKYGVQMKADNADNFRIFGSLRSLAQYVGQHRPQ
ncbi:acyl carrier protein [Ideonella sp. B7]|uniref:phosphopantetheine-binding protein n=1 Tax=Ideonella benzenivorans TaxID=2831643 RepID=UPI001CEDF5B0|nr:phosphopantetheine-binding protein [Ideonella benzenivorans]MCA6216624.1 acyl carrier protein [Ideonella benzenivorans]